MSKTTGQTLLSRRSAIGAMITSFVGLNALFFWQRKRWGKPTIRIIAKGPFVAHKRCVLQGPEATFVSPHYLKLDRTDDRKVSASILFAFKGEIDPNALILMRISLLNRDGREMGHADEHCYDARIGPRTVHAGTVTATLIPVNSVSTDIALTSVATSLNEIAEARIDFTRVS